MRKHLLTILSLVLAAITLTGLFGCSGGDEIPEDDPDLGLYLLDADDSTELPHHGKIDADVSIELRAGGKAVLRLGDKEKNATWKKTGSDITIRHAGVKFTGTVADGVITVDISGAEFTFRRG